MESHWSGYLKALEQTKPPRTTVDTVSTGFADWKTHSQKKYDAINGSWQGIKASETASIYKPDFMSVERK